MNYEYFKDNIKKNNLNEEIIKSWYDKQLELLNQYNDTIEEKLNNDNFIKMMIILFNTELKKKEKIKKIKNDNKFFRKTLKKKKTNLFSLK
tara:strand:+ start:1706 stop:1978 length:273 start_codon:yes stop_codon:yes gene_type:complete